MCKHRNGGILVYRFNRTNPAPTPWDFSPVGDWPQPKIDQVGWPPPGYSDADGYWDGIVTTPALGDLDGDGDLEIVIEGIDRRIHAWHHNGTAVNGWPISQWDGDALWRGGLSSPALGDLDGDGLPEVVVGTMSPLTGGQTNKEATLWAINGDSTSVPGFPVKTEQMLHSSPALGDIDGDSKLEIVSAVGWGTPSRENIVYAWNHDGTLVPNWPQETAGVTAAPPALGDIDGDGELEIVVGCGNNYATSSCNMLHAWNDDGSSVFTAQPPAYHPTQAMPYSPILADIDGDSAIEILVVHLGDWGVTVVEANGSSGSQTHQTNGGLKSPPMVDDVDNDGKLEVVVGGADYPSNKGAVWIWDEAGSASPPPPWPMFHHDVRRTGRYLLPPQLGFPSEIRVFHQSGSGDTASQDVGVWNKGEGQFDWSIKHSITRLQVTPSSSTVESNASVRFVITTTGLLTGWQLLGTVTITGTVGGEPVDGSPQDAPVYVYVGDVARIYLPVVLRNN
jgi:hypothetical protein